MMQNDLFTPTFFGYMTVVALLGIIVHGNSTLQDQITNFREAMPHVADFIEKDICERMDSLDRRIQKLEMQTCRCGLGQRSVTQEPEDKECLNGKNCTIDGKKCKATGKEQEGSEVSNRLPASGVEWNQNKEQGPVSN